MSVTCDTSHFPIGPFWPCLRLLAQVASFLENFRHVSTAVLSLSLDFGEKAGDHVRSRLEARLGLWMHVSVRTPTRIRRHCDEEYREQEPKRWKDATLRMLTHGCVPITACMYTMHASKCVFWCPAALHLWVMCWDNFMEAWNRFICAAASYASRCNCWVWPFLRKTILQTTCFIQFLYVQCNVCVPFIPYITRRIPFASRCDRRHRHQHIYLQPVAFVLSTGLHLELCVTWHLHALGRQSTPGELAAIVLERHEMMVSLHCTYWKMFLKRNTPNNYQCYLYKTGQWFHVLKFTISCVKFNFKYNAAKKK